MQSPTLKLGVSGVRGIAGVSLTPQIVASFAAAFGTYCGPGRIVIGSDTRPSREMITPAVEAGLLSVGCTPVLLGVVPVPTLLFHVRRTGAAGGICITASHNPMEWNALKFCSRTGTALFPNQFAELLDLYHQGLYPRVPSAQIPDSEVDTSALEGHLEAVRGLVDLDVIRRRTLKIAIDCCNGAGSSASPAFLETLGCEVVAIHADPEKPFPRDPEPLRQNLGDLCKAVREVSADIGFAQDADADRLAIVDETGLPLGENCTLALAALHVLRREPGPIVVNASTSRMLTDLAAELGCPSFVSRVGEVHVVQMMERTGARIGGEGNGGVIVPSVNRCRDSYVAMALILELLCSERLKVSALRQRLPRYAMVMEKVPCRPTQAAAFIRLLRQLFADQQIDLTDGIKISWPDRWLHVRPSGTEPILRILAESGSERESRSLVEHVMEYLRPLDLAL